MQLKKPTHATAIAYLALFAALGGTAIAARDNLGAKEIKPLIVRKEKTRVGSGPATAVVRCRSNEQLISGAGGWNRPGGDSGTPRISRIAAVAGGAKAAPKSFVVQGRSPTPDNTLVAQALCLPK